MIIVFGFNAPMRLQIEATTYKDGDPSFAGPLAGIALGIPSYHILEIKDLVPADVWEAEMGMKELEIEDSTVEGIMAVMKEVRGGEAIIKSTNNQS